MKIELEQVTKKFKKKIVINHIDMLFESGNVYGVNGINGSGKTMLLRLISGLIYPTSGVVRVNGKILGQDMDFPENMGLLIENPDFLNRYSGFQNLKMLASIKGKISDQEIEHTIERVGLDPDDKVKFQKYSLGMKQRLGIAAAIMESPELILLDEPTNALDTDGIERLKKIIQEEKERGALIILSSHDKLFLDEMSDLCISVVSGGIL